MRLILIRHGQTPNNVLHLLDTSVPGPGLTPLGHEQAAAVVGELAGLAIEAIYISNLTRTALTAAPLADALGLTPQVRDGLREISAGDLEMKGDPASIGAYMEVMKSWLTGDLSVRMPGADSGFEVLARFDAVVAEALASGAETVAVVSHGAMIRFWAGLRGNNIDWSNKAYHELSNTGIVTMTRLDSGRDGQVLEADAGNSAGAPGGWNIDNWQGKPAGGLAGSRDDGPTDQLDPEPSEETNANKN